MRPGIPSGTHRGVHNGLRTRAAHPLAGTDTDDFDAWVQPHLTVLRALARREVDATVADDIVQEALLRAWQRRSTFDPSRGSARAWLVAIVLDKARRYRTRLRPEAVVAEGADAESESDSDSAAPDQRLDIEAAVRQLAPRQRQIVTLHYLADLPLAEVGAVLGVSEGAVKAQLSDARTRLRTIMETAMSDSRG